MLKIQAPALAAALRAAFEAHPEPALSREQALSLALAALADAGMATGKATSGDVQAIMRAGGAWLDWATGSVTVPAFAEPEPDAPEPR